MVNRGKISSRQGSRSAGRGGRVSVTRGARPRPFLPRDPRGGRHTWTLRLRTIGVAVLWLFAGSEAEEVVCEGTL